MSNVFVIRADSAAKKLADAAAAEKEPRLAYASMVSTSTIVASHDFKNTGYLYDGMTTLKWRPANSTPTLTFTGTFSNTDYVGIAGVNWATAGCVATVKDSGGNILGTVSGLRDNQSALFIFAKATYTSILIEFTCTNTLLEVGEVYLGESLAFPRNVSVGYKPGRWHSNDLITNGRTEANQFSGSVVRARGTTESFSINNVPVSFMEFDYKNFVINARGLPVFFLWNKNNIGHAIFGSWTATAPTFTSSFLSSINITINGAV